MGARRNQYLPVVLGATAVCGLALHSWYARRQQDAVISELRGTVALLTTTAGDSGVPRSVAASARRDQLQRAFSRDRPTDLAHDSREAMERALAAALPKGSVLRALDCTSFLCRIETEHAGRQGYEQFVRAAFLRPAEPHGILSRPTFSAPLSEEPTQDGTLVAVTFLAQDGYALPSASSDPGSGTLPAGR
jgi:hypothetical protein